MFTCIQKHYTKEEWSAFNAETPAEDYNYLAITSGTSDKDYERLFRICGENPAIKFICIDVANGYSQHFVEYVRRVRENFPEMTIIAGNVVTGEMTEELILSGADIVKVGNAEIGMAAMGVSIVLTLLLVAFQRFVVKKTGSVAITADYAHYAGDVMMNLSVVASLFVSARFRFPYSDPIFALAIAVYLLVCARRVFGQAMVQLIDAELPHAEKQKIANIVLTTPDVSGLHDLRTRSSGTQWFIQLHLELDPDLSLSKAEFPFPPME